MPKPRRTSPSNQTHTKTADPVSVCPQQFSRFLRQDTRKYCAAGACLSGRTLEQFPAGVLVSEHWIRRFSLALLEKKKKIVVFFVDLDNVPRFFKTFTLDTLQQIEQRMPCETFVVCSSCQIYEHQRILEGNWNQQQLNRIHFTLANAHKDSADAVCTVEYLNLKKWNQHKTAK